MEEQRAGIHYDFSVRIVPDNALKKGNSLTQKQRQTLLRVYEGEQLFVNQDVPHPYAYLNRVGELDILSIRTVRALLRRKLIEKAPTIATAGSFEFQLTLKGKEIVKIYDEE